MEWVVYDWGAEVAEGAEGWGWMMCIASAWLSLAAQEGHIPIQLLYPSLMEGPQRLPKLPRPMKPRLLLRLPLKPLPRLRSLLNLLPLLLRLLLKLELKLLLR